MSSRPISDQIRRWLLGELETWRTTGILSADQPGRILQLYETEADAAKQRRSLATFVLSSLAAAMIGLAVLLLIGYNWQEMPPAGKLTIIFTSLIGFHAAGAWLRSSSRPLASEIAFFGACFLFGAAIWLIAQIFNIQSHYPDGIWCWAIGLLPFALFLDTLLMHVFYAAMLALWVYAEILGDCGFGLGGSNFFLSGHAVTLPILVLPGLLWAYRRRSALTVAVYVPLLAWWTILQPSSWHWDINPVYFIGLVGALLILTAECHPVGSLMAVPYRLYGVLIVAGVLIPLSFADVIIELMRDRHTDQNLAVGAIILGAGLAATLLAIAVQRRRSAKTPGDVARILRRQWLPLAVVLLMAGTCAWCGMAHDFDGGGAAAKWSPEVLIPMTIANVLMIALSIWLMGIGLREDRGRPFAGGVLYFMLWALLRYADLFAGIGGMLGAAAMFLLCGVGLFVIARFWVSRKVEPAGVPEAIVDEAAALTLTLSQRERGPATQKSRRQWLMAAGVGLQLVLLVGMIGQRMILLQTGKTVLLRVVPVDPRDIFRGDYVTLSYDISRITDKNVDGFPPRANVYGDEWRGKTIYAILAQEPDGQHWRLDRFSVKKPDDGVFIRGTIGWTDRVAYGIESFYVQEGEGREYEQAVRSQKLSAEVVVSSDGQAALKNLIVEEKTTADSKAESGSPQNPKNAGEYATSDATYRVRYLPDAKITIDGRADDSAWSRANVERHFVYPWKKADAPPTEFMALCDKNYLYFAFRVEDSDIFVLDKLRDKEDEMFEDRVEMYFSTDSLMANYYCLEIDSRGRIYDYRGSYYRKIDAKWTFPGVEAKASTTDRGYAVEGRIPLSSFVRLGFPRLQPDTKILFGMYRAEFSHDASGKPVEQKETIHNRGRKLDITPPIEEWMSWIDPKTPEPDFHVPASLGWLEIEN